MKKIILLFFVAFNTAFVAAQTAYMSFKTGKHVDIAGTQVSMVPPPGFDRATNFAGFQQDSTGASIMVLQVPGPFGEMKGAFTKENLATKGMELLEKTPISINGKPGELIMVEQYSAAHGQYFLKYSLLLELESKNTLIINGSYPKDKGAETGSLIKESITTVIYDQTVKNDPLAGLDFTVDYSKSPFKLSNSISGTLLLDGKEKGIIIIVKSIRPVSTIDKEGSSIQILKAIPAISYQSLESSKEVSVDDLDGYQIIANVLQKEMPYKAVQTILFSENCYYNFTALVPSLTREIMTDYEYILNSFRRK
ncbi:MAG: hypothetical protein WAT19_15085 [Ferruginibacter sp.]